MNRFYDGKRSICWDCANSVPNEQYGCTWSRRGEPVEGWDAERRDLLLQDSSKKMFKYVEPYRVKECPHFIYG